MIDLKDEYTARRQAEANQACEEKLVLEERKACAALVEAGECVCLYLFYLYEEWSSFGPNNTPDSIITSLVAAIHIDHTTDLPTVTKHAPCCCKALADQIRRQP